ncbi:MAG: hypothetical protein GX361_09460 [Bacteroidales bacterium]|nr:hypothetical protein [Bacteroidales bacterium]
MKKEEALLRLLEKYSVETKTPINIAYGWSLLNKQLQKNDVPLLTWRANRKFIELHKIVSGDTIENVCMLRFCSFGGKKWSLDALMYKEFDLCEYLGGGKIVSLHAVLNERLAGNIIVKLDNGIIGSVEVSVQAQPEEKLLDRHEIIARRGVASDLVTDTQISQSSIYTYTNTGASKYKDVDYELFGLNELEVEYIRSAFEVYKEPSQITKLQNQHAHLSVLVKAAFESNFKKQKIEIK